MMDDGKSEALEQMAGETAVLGENLPNAALSTSNPHDLTRAAVVGSQ
jgi:hypothetical protein